MQCMGTNSMEGYHVSLHELIALCELINEWLHASKGETGQSAVGSMLYWTWGKLLLLKMARDESVWATKWTAFLLHNGVSFQSYSKVKGLTDHALYRFSIRSMLKFMNVCPAIEV